MEIAGPIWSRLDTALRARREFTYVAIEEELAKIYGLDADEPLVADDEAHEMVSQAHGHYVTLGLAQEGI